MRHLIKILKKDVPFEKPFFVNLAGEPGVIIFRENNSFRVLKNVCPHMGGFFTSKDYCSRQKKMTCPWHAYEFSLSTLQLEKNPSVDEWIAKLVSSDSHYLKPRKMKLVELPFVEEKEVLWLKLGFHEV